MCQLFLYRIKFIRLFFPAFAGATFIFATFGFRFTAFTFAFFVFAAPVLFIAVFAAFACSAFVFTTLGFRFSAFAVSFFFKQVFVNHTGDDGTDDGSHPEEPELV